MLGLPASPRVCREGVREASALVVMVRVVRVRVGVRVSFRVRGRLASNESVSHRM